MTKVNENDSYRKRLDFANGDPLVLSILNLLAELHKDPIWPHVSSFVYFATQDVEEQLGLRPPANEVRENIGPASEPFPLDNSIHEDVK